MFVSIHGLNLQGIWRISIDEINRSGSFATHMYKSVMLLLDVLREQRDYTQLYTATVQLNRTPDPGKYVQCLMMSPQILILVIYSLGFCSTVVHPCSGGLRHIKAP